MEDYIFKFSDFVGKFFCDFFEKQISIFFLKFFVILV